MKTLVFVLLCVAVANARWHIYTSKADDDDHDHDHDHELDWWEHGVFYQIYPNSFKDSNADGFGDLKGITSKLGHLKDLGVTGAWLSPIFRSPMRDGGYDIQDFYNVNPRFGTNQDLKDLFAEAKKLGLKIILDFVPNHTSDQHDWFLLSRNRTEGYEDYYVWRDCPLYDEPNPEKKRRYFNNWIAVFHTPAWTYDPVRGQCYLHQFTPEQPDLNYRNEKVYNGMMDILLHWLEQGADGFRIDAINHMFESENLAPEQYIDPLGDRTSYDNLIHTETMNRNESYEFIYDVRKMMDKFVAKSEDKVTRLMMTEAYASIPEQIRWYGASEEKQGSHFPFNFALISNLDKDSSAKDFKNATDSWMLALPTYGNANWVLGNHDRPRVAYRYGENRHESLAIMTMMLPGLNVIYYGEEIRMTNNMNIKFEESDDPQARQTNASVYLQFTRDPVRTPFQWDDTANAGFSDTTNKTWLPIHENYKTLNLAAQKKAEKSTYKLYQKLIELRKKNHVLQIGGYESKAVDTNVFAFTRTLKDHNTIAVYVNLGDAATVNLKDLLDKEEFSDETKAKILIVNNESKLVAGNMVEDVQKISLGQYDAVVLEVSSATKLAISMLLVVCSLIKFIF